MRFTRYALLLVALFAGSCSTWNVADKEIKPDGTTPTPPPTPVPNSNGAVTLNSAKPTALGHTTATISFKVEKPQGVVEYGAVLTTNPSDINAVIAGTSAPLRKPVTAAFPGTGTVDFELTGLNENSLYYAVPYVKDGAGKTTFCNAAVGFKTKYPATNANWRQLANLPTQRAYAYNPLFTIDGKVYVGGADQESPQAGYYYFKQLYEYDPQTNIWTKKKDFGGTARSEPTVAVLNNKAYIMFGTALGGGYTPDAWEYDPAADSWRQVAVPPPTATGGQGQYNKQAGAIPFVYNNRVWALFGRGTFNDDPKLVNIYNSLYAFEPATNTWTVSFPLNEQKYPTEVIYAAARSAAFSFQYDKWVYFGGGLAASSYNATGTSLPYARYFVSRQIWGYNVETKETKKIALLPASFNDCSDPNATGGRMAGFAFVVGSKAYITDCNDGNVFIMNLTSGDFTPQATTLKIGIGSSRRGTTGIGIGVGNKAYYGLRNADWWEFTP